MKNAILTADKGLKTKFDASQVQYKKTFAEAKQKGVDLNNTTQMFKKDGVIYDVCFVSYVNPSSGKRKESINIHPFIVMKNQTK